MKDYVYFSVDNFLTLQQTSCEIKLTYQSYKYQQSKKTEKIFFFGFCIVLKEFGIVSHYNLLLFRLHIYIIY